MRGGDSGRRPINKVAEREVKGSADSVSRAVQRRDRQTARQDRQTDR